MSHCKSCHAPIVWMKAHTGKNVPVDTATAGTTRIYDPALGHVSHFATCPHKKQHEGTGR